VEQECAAWLQHNAISVLDTYKPRARESPNVCVRAGGLEVRLYRVCVSMLASCIRSVHVRWEPHVQVYFRDVC
jgi:hypothetical protein